MKISGVKCDQPGCGWAWETGNWKVWVQKACPKCGKGEIITKKEVAILRIFQAAEGVMRVMAAVFRIETQKVRVDVGPMREGKPPTIKKLS